MPYLPIRTPTRIAVSVSSSFRNEVWIAERTAPSGYALGREAA